MQADYILGIDLGTSGCKAGLFDSTGTPVGEGQASYPLNRATGGLAEQDPLDWWHGACAAVRLAIQAAPSGRIAAIGLSGQIGSQALIGPTGDPIRPAITWQDTRSGPAAADLNQQIGRARLAASLGIDLPPGALWPLPRLIWLKKTFPAVFEAEWRLLQAKDYIAYRLTGELASDPSSWRGIIDQRTWQPASDLLKQLELPDDRLPAIRGPAEIMGQVTVHAAEATGIPVGTPVVTGWNDMNCAVLGTGVTLPGDGFNIGGTSEHIGMAWGSANPPGDTSRIVLGPYLRGMPDCAPQVLYGATSAGGGAWEWYTSGLITGMFDTLVQAPPADLARQLVHTAAETPAGAEGLLFLPYLNGERAPIWDALARGVFIGVSSAHGHQHFTRAVLEGVALSLRHVLTTVESAASTSVGPIYISGGPARIELWNKIKASVLRRPLLVPQVLDTSCLGSAILATIGAGWFDSAVSATRAMVHIARQIDPESDAADIYDQVFPIYTSLYPALQQTYAELAKLR